MGQALLASLFVLCLNFLILIEVLPFTPAGCVAALLLGGLGTSAVRYLILREFGLSPEAAWRGTAAYFIVVFLVYSCGVGLFMSWLLGSMKPMDIAFRGMFLLTFMTAWGFFRDARKRPA